MVNNNERKTNKKEAKRMDGENVGVVPGDTIASALDPFGSAAGPISVENSVSEDSNKNKED